MFTVIVVSIGAVALLITTGYLLGTQSGREAREALRRQNAADAEEMARLRERVAEQHDDEEKLRVAIQRVNSVTLCRLFHVDKQRLSLTAVSQGVQLAPAALDPVLVPLQAALMGSGVSLSE